MSLGQTTPPSPVVISDEVMKAIAHRAPVVALETAVLTHGLPRESWRVLSGKWSALKGAPAWLDGEQPLNRAAMLAMSEAVRNAGATPAVTAVLHGQLRLGMSDDEIRVLAEATDARKVARRDLAAACMARASGGTTVSAALAIACAGGVDVFATGGIGGVHRGWQQSADISADLLALSQHAVCVVCSGAKSILDIPATLEALEALSVPIAGYGCDAFPRFVCVSDPARAVPQRVDTVQQVATMALMHWSLKGGALLVVQPVDSALALSAEVAERAQHTAAMSATARGAEATPELLGRVADLTSGGSLLANLALLRDNAALAARIATALRTT